MLTNKHKLISLSMVILGLTTCSVPATGDITHNAKTTPIIENTNKSLIPYLIEQQELYEAKVELAELKQKAKDHALKMDKAIARLERYVDKTWYVFSGSTPKGWDCSGLTKWFYKYFDLDLEHRASKQAKAGKVIEVPMRGDLVVFKYKGSDRVYHVGVYTGKDMMIHAPREGQRTREESISDFAGDYSNVFYVRIVEIS